MKNLIGHCVVFLISTIARFLAILPHRLFLCCVDSLAWLLRTFDSRRKKDAQSNLDFVFQHLTPQEKQAMIVRAYRNFAFVCLEALRAIYLCREKHFARFDYENLHYLTDRVKNEESVVIISAHFGYWEAIGSALPRFLEGYGRYSLGRLTQFEPINRLIIQSRQAYGVKLINKKGALKDLIKIYNQPKQIAGILVDQNVSPSEGVWVKFFDKEVTHTPVASILSRRFGVKILPVFIDFNEDYTRFKVIFCEPFLCKNTENMQADILDATQKQASLTQEIIQNNPSSYFWFHKRFKSKYPHLY